MDNGYVNEQEVSDLAYNYMMQYGVNINLQRAIPMVNDGLKPVIRRILYIMYKNYKTNKVKGSVAIGQVLTIHPHSDMGLGGVLAKMAQTFTNNIPLLSTIDTGNSGNIVNSNDYASPRYLDIKMSQFAMDILFDEFDGKYNMRLSYDESSVEPIVLPAKFPLILLNGTSGIGYTLSSDIHPYNLNEIADATIKLLKNPNANIHLVPDLPTGCNIIVKSETSFVMESSFDIDNINYIITIKNTPYQRYLDDIDEKLREIQDSANPISEILSADDESELIEDKVRYVIRCKPCNLYNIVNILFKRVPGFRAGINASNMIVVDNFQTCKYDVRQILCSWIKNRLMEKRSYYLRALVATTTEVNMLEGKAHMLSPENLDKTIKVFRSCNAKDEIVPKLVDAYNGEVSSSQANYVSELHVYNLTNGEYEKTLKGIGKTKDDVTYIRAIVADPEKVKEVIIEEIKTIKAKYGTPRKSKILNNTVKENINIDVVQLLVDGSIIFGETENPEHLSSDITPISGENVCLLDELGNFLWININKVDHDRPLTLTSIGKVPMGKCIAAISNEDNNVLLLTNKGRIKYMPVSRIPTNATKKQILQMDNNEFIVSVLEIGNDASDILVYTTDGMGKRIQLSNLNKQLSLDASGQFIMNDYNVGGMFCLNPNKPLLVYVTKLGKLRVNQMKFLSTVKKFAEPNQIIKLSQQDDLISVFCTTDKKSITLNHADGRVSTVNIDTLPVSTMAVEPVRPKHVPGVKVIRATLQ